MNKNLVIAAFALLSTPVFANDLNQQIGNVLMDVLRTTAQSHQSQSVGAALPASRPHASQDQGRRHSQFDQCKQFFYGGAVPHLPSSAPGRQRDVCFDSFAVLHSGESKTPIYVVERVNRRQLSDAKDEERTNRFYEEARLPSADRAKLDDSRGSGFDRGHLAPAANMPNAQSMAQSFSLANMVPQAPEHNRKIWSRVESDTRSYIRRATGDVYIVTGTHHEGRVNAIGKGKVWVPPYIYKLVYDPSTGRAWAHWHKNSDNTRSGKPISYEELVAKTNINFFPGAR